MELYKAFRGQLPGIEALLRRSGIPVDPEEIAAFRKNHELDCRYLRMAHIWAENSYCQRRQVGALIVKDKMIISDGYNGTHLALQNLMYFMLRLMPLQKLLVLIIMRTAQPFMSQMHLA